MVLGCGILLVFSRCSCGQQWFEVEDSADLGPITLFLVLTQGLQAATDYGISIPANALTFALMLGALTGGWGRRDEALTGTSPRVMWRWIPIAALSAVMVAGWQELRSAAEVAKFHSTLGNLDAPVAADWTTFKTMLRFLNATITCDNVRTIFWFIARWRNSTSFDFDSFFPRISSLLRTKRNHPNSSKPGRKVTPATSMHYVVTGCGQETRHNF